MYRMKAEDRNFGTYWRKNSFNMYWMKMEDRNFGTYWRKIKLQYVLNESIRQELRYLLKKEIDFKMYRMKTGDETSVLIEEKSSFNMYWIKAEDMNFVTYWRKASFKMYESWKINTGTLVHFEEELASICTKRMI